MRFASICWRSGIGAAVEFQIEHVHPKDRGGSDRVSNSALACPACNTSKSNQPLAEFLAQDAGRRRRATQHAKTYAGKNPRKQKERAEWEDTHLERVQRQIKAPLKDAAATTLGSPRRGMNATHWRLYDQLRATGLSVEGGSGGRTKMQRMAYGLPKEHDYHALCIGASTPAAFVRLSAYVQVLSAKGRGHRQMCGTGKYSFPIRHRSRHKQHFGFQTGDLVVARVPNGKYVGVWKGRVSARASDSFDITAGGHRVAQRISYKHCRIRNKGWHYEQKPRAV